MDAATPLEPDPALSLYSFRPLLCLSWSSQAALCCGRGANRQFR